MAIVDDTPRCGRTKRAGGACQRPAGYGTTHPGAGPCKSHGGNVPAVAARGERELADRLARQWFGREIDAQPVEDPLSALKILAGECLAWKDQVSRFLDDLSNVGVVNMVGGEEVRAQVVVFERALDRCEHVLSSLARLKIDERLARIEQDKADMIVRAVEAALKASGIDATRWPAVRRAFAGQLRVIDGELAA